MSLNPFHADPSIATRIAQLSAAVGAGLASEITRLVVAKARRPQANLGSVILQAEAEKLCADFGLAGIDELMLLALASARQIARPPISNFYVGIVGLEKETGNLVLGGNMEFPRTHLGFTVHGEGFVFTRGASRGTTITRIALGEAHPCAHCRQYLSEFAATRDLVLIDLLGHRLSMAELYPWPFDPGYLGELGYASGAIAHPDLELAANALPAATAAALRDAGRRAHAPYSKCPGAVVLTLKDGGLVTGISVESVAFNPTMGPLQAAMIDLVAHGYETPDIVSAALGTQLGGDVDYSHSIAELLGKIAPGVPLTVVGWA